MNHLWQGQTEPKRGARGELVICLSYCVKRDCDTRFCGPMVKTHGFEGVHVTRVRFPAEPESFALRFCPWDTPEAS